MFHKAIDLKFKENTTLEVTFQNGEKNHMIWLLYLQNIQV